MSPTLDAFSTGRNYISGIQGLNLKIQSHTQWSQVSRLKLGCNHQQWMV